MARTRSAAAAHERHRPLNRDLILDGAIELIERDGPSSLSMRRLGSQLGVEGTAIYHHFTSRDELLSAIGDRLLGPLRLLELGEDWREACSPVRHGASGNRRPPTGDVRASRPAATRHAGIA